MGAGDLNLGIHASTASTLPVGPAPQTPIICFLKIRFKCSRGWSQPLSDQDDLELQILPPPVCWDHRCAPPPLLSGQRTQRDFTDTPDCSCLEGQPTDRRKTQLLSSKATQFHAELGHDEMVSQSREPKQHPSAGACFHGNAIRVHFGVVWGFHSLL